MTDSEELTGFLGESEDVVVGFHIPTNVSGLEETEVDEEDVLDSSDDEEEQKNIQKRIANARHRAPIQRQKEYIKMEPIKQREAVKRTMSDGKVIDYVFVVELPEDKDEIRRLEKEAEKPATSSDEHTVKQTRKRRIFFENCLKQGISLESDVSPDGTLQFIRAHVSFNRLLVEAERNNLCMTLKPEVSAHLDQAIKQTLAGRIEDNVDSMIDSLLSRMQPDIEEEGDSFSAAFHLSRLDEFVNSDKEDIFFTTAQRSDLTYCILNHMSYGRKASQKGLHKLIANGSFSAAYPLHDGAWGEKAKDEPVAPHGNDRQKLYEHWGRLGCWYLLQPYDLIRRYFGVKIGLYFAWLGFYTWALIVPSFLGLIIFIIGAGTVSDQGYVDELCNSNLTMCAICDDGCDRWQLNDACGGYKFGYMFDNPGTVAFATFMALWASVFLDFWKRRQSFLAYDWDTRNYNDVEPLRPQFRGTTKRPNPITGKPEKFYPSALRQAKECGSIITMLTMIGIVIVVVVGILFYRLAVRASLFKQSGNAEDANLITAVTAALLNLAAIMLLSSVYRGMAVRLTEWENHRLDSEYQSALTAKIFMFQFANNYASLFYIAFFKGRFTGIPGSYNYILGFRQDECPPDLGCMGELTLQLAIIFVGRQTINNFQEMLLPPIMRWWRKRNAGEEFQASFEDMSLWERDYFLDPYPHDGMFNEYLELMLQYGYITMFVPAFSLAPLFALLNNIFEIRVDAHKLLTVYRRPPAVRAANIGVWYEVLTTISFFAVIINAMVIAFTSSFIPRQVYMYGRPGNVTSYIDRIYPLSPVTDPNAQDYNCHYWGYQEDNGEEGIFYYQVIAARLAFVVVFEHFVFLTKVLIERLIPDVPKSVQLSIKRENYLAQQALERTFGAKDEVLKKDLKRASEKRRETSTSDLPQAEED